MPGRTRVRHRRWQATLIITLVFSAAVGAAAVGWWYARESPPHQGPIVLLAVDGLSSSALTAYGARTSAAPAIDALAEEGVVFERAYIHSPAMLPAYTSLLTGQLPFDHGVRDEAGFALKTDTRTLPELLRSRGFATGAAVSSFLLRKATGLTRGFAFYGGELGAVDGKAAQDRPVIERPGMATFDAAAQWLRSQGGQRFMLFMEVPAADADSVVRGVVDLLKERGLYEKATFIVVGGRGAGAATGHLDDATLRIPLIVRQPDRDGAGRRVHAPVQHIDLMPTVLDLVRAPIPGRLRGRSLRPVLDDSDATVPVRPLYAESLSAWYRFGGRPAYALTSDGARLVRDADDQLVPLDGAASLPNPTPVVQNAAALSAELDRLLEGRAPAPAAALSTLDAELFAQLGILMATSDLPETVATALPSDQAALLDGHGRAARLVGTRQFGAAAAGLKELVRANPQVPALQLQLGTLLERAGRLEEAITVFAEADGTWPDRVPLTLALSHALARAGRLDQAQQKADAAVALTEGGTPADRAAALEAAARIAIDRRDVAAAEKSAQARFDLDGSRALRQFVRGRELLDGGHYEEAQAALLEAARGDGETAALPGLHLALGETLVHLEQPADAEAQLKEEVRLFPLDPRAYVTLATLYHSLEREDDAAQVLEDLLEALPTPEGSSAAARAWTAMGNRERADAVRADARERFKGDPSLNLLGRGRP